MTGKEYDGPLGIYDGLEPLQRMRVEACEVQIDAVDRRDADGTFRMGEALKVAHAIFQEPSFLRWCDSKWRYHRSYAYDFMRVADTLEPFRARLVAAKVPRAALIDLSSAPACVEQVLDAIDAGQKLKVRDIRTIIASNGRKTPDLTCLPADMGGTSGIKRLCRAKAMFVPGLVRRLAWIRQQIDEALEPTLAGKRVLKGPLAERIVLPARHARNELESLCLFVEPHEADPSVFRVMRFPEGSRWARFSDLLFQIGGRESWPPSTELEAWLRVDVLPQLNWAIGDHMPNDSTEAIERIETKNSNPASSRTEAEGSFEEAESGNVRESGGDPPPLGNFAETELLLDMHRYCLPVEAVLENAEYQIELSDEKQIHVAALRGGYWVGRDGLLAAPEEVSCVMAPEDAVRSAIDFLLFVRARGRFQGETEATLDQVGPEIAAVFANIIVCLNTSPDAEDSSPSARRVIRDALHEDCLLAEEQQRLFAAPVGCLEQSWRMRLKSERVGSGGFRLQGCRVHPAARNTALRN